MGNRLPYGLGGRGHCVDMLGGAKGKVNVLRHHPLHAGIVADKLQLISLGVGYIERQCTHACSAVSTFDCAGRTGGQCDMHVAWAVRVAALVVAPLIVREGWEGNTWQTLWVLLTNENLSSRENRLPIEEVVA